MNRLFVYPSPFAHGPAIALAVLHRLVSAIAFGDRTARGQIYQGKIYKLCDLIFDSICTAFVMVVSAKMAGFTHAVTSKFARDEPWPDWCDPHGLQRDFGIVPALHSQLLLDEITPSTT